MTVGEVREDQLRLVSSLPEKEVAVTELSCPFQTREIS